MRILMTTIGLGVLLAGVPASANVTTADSTNTNATSQTSPAKPATTANVKERKYCIPYEDMTGSRVSASECRTKAAWAKKGVNVDDLAKSDQ